MKQPFLWLLVLLAGCTDPNQPQSNASATSNDVGVANQAAAAGAAESPSNSGNRAKDVPIAAENRQQQAGQHDPARNGGTPADACRSRQYRYLIGQHRSRIPGRPPGETWRVTCTSCPVTMDYSERRLNILYDQESGIVEDVRCG